MILHTFLDVFYLLIDDFDDLLLNDLCFLPDLCQFLVLARLQRVDLIAQGVHLPLEALHLSCLPLQLLDFFESPTQLAYIVPHVAGEERLDYSLRLAETIVDGSLMPPLKLLKLTLLEAIPQPSIYFMYLLGYFLPLTHI